ncbi:hypothetical protein ACVDG8_013235 [Mesorhizobium sp. ORM8.1]
MQISQRDNRLVDTAGVRRLALGPTEVARALVRKGAGGAALVALVAALPSVCSMSCSAPSVEPEPGGKLKSMDDD